MKTSRKISFASRFAIRLKSISIVLCSCTLLAQHALGQFADNFSDHNFTGNPSWAGSTSDFIINASDQLQLSTTAAGTSYLVVPFSFIALGESEWQFSIHQNFSSSTTNFGRVYLMSNQQNLATANGYYLQFGEAGSNDAVELFRQTGPSSTSVCRAASAGAIANTFNITVKVNRSINGEWELWVDYTGGTNFILEASGTDNTHVSTSYFGIQCTYTTTNAMKFFFDDFFIGAIPPVVTSVLALSQTEVEVLFSETVTTSAETEMNYSIAGGTVNPISAVLLGDQKTVKLTFAQAFVNGMQQTLSVINVSDLKNNLITPTDRNFLFFQPHPASGKDIIITEIFPDFSPAEGLPEAEFIEIFNRSQHPFHLAGWKITDGSSIGTLSGVILLPDEYIILSLPVSQSQFNAFGKTMGVPSFPSLNNAGDVLVLKDPTGQTIDSLTYASTWYKDDDKKDGGWTLERIDPENFCKGSDNWKASTSSTGGTPGHQNAVFQNTPDVTGPKFIAASFLSPNVFTLAFDEKLFGSIPSVNNFSVDPFSAISAVTFTDASLTKINLQLETTPDSTVTYTITASTIFDCPGNVIQTLFSSATLKLDSKLPDIVSVVNDSQSSLKINFSEKITKTSAENILNYELAQTVNPVQASLSSNRKTVTLNFEKPFVNGATHILKISGIADLANNTMLPDEKPFTFFEPVPSSFKDIIISEIFPDPAPQRNLPEVEFVELYNRSHSPFDLNGWTLSDGTSMANLTGKILLPEEHLIICVVSKVPLFISYGKTMGTITFPSLNNSGDALVLKDPHGVTIDSVSYTDKWYKDDEKKDGGWTLELIDPMNICSESDNWIASEDERGGTPGTQNSVHASKPDLTGPRLISVIPVSPTQLILRFDEKLEKQLPSTENFIFEPALSINKISFADPSLTSFNVTLAQPLQGSVEHHLRVRDIFDCSGNKIAEDSQETTFALPEEADSLDIAINEILFNPRSTGVDFVEVYNRSAKFINLKNWVLANRDLNGAPVNNKIITADDFLLKPGQYIVFTEDAAVLKSEYLQSKEETFFETDMPSFPDDEGSVMLIDPQGKMIDAFSYSDKMHVVFLKENEGVSLERISMESPTDEWSNWKTASSVSGYATPGYLNSNATAAGIMDEAVAIDPEIFLPLSGQPDFTQIRYRFDQGGYVANVKIFDPHGRTIKHLANNAILGTEGSFRWDGDHENGGKARMGSYMVWFEVFDDRGTVRTFRKRVVVANQ